VDLLNQLFSSGSMLPLGHCYGWLPSLVWLQATAGLIAGSACMLIPFALLKVYRQRWDVPFRWSFLVFAGFIFACGLTQLLDVWTLWVPSHWLQGGVKVVTAALSIMAVFTLTKVMPDAVGMGIPVARAGVAMRQSGKSDPDWRVRTAELETANARLARQFAERVKVEQALRDSEEQLRTLVEHAPEAIVVLDLGQGCFSLVNENACRLFGLPRAELLLRDPVQLSAPLQPDGRLARESAREKIEAALHGETPVFEWMHRDAQGRDILCEVRLVRLPSSGAPLVRGSILDIRGRKAMENALRESEAKFATVFHNCPEPITIGLWPEGTYVDVNEAYERQFGWARAEVLNRSDMSLGLWTKPEQHAELARLLDQDRQVDAFEAEFLGRDGSTWIGQIAAALTQINGRLCAVMVLRDVTLARQAERALRESEAKFSTVFRTCPESISFSLREDGTYVEVNEAYERLFGYSRSAVIGRSAVGLGIWADPAERAALLERLDLEGRVTGFEVKFKRKDAEIWIGELSAGAMVLDGRRCVVFVVRDVTAQRQAGEALKRSEERFSTVFRTCPETITIATLADGTYLDVNEAFERLYGVSRDEAIGNSSLALGLWVDPGRRRELVRQLEQNRRVTGFPNLIRHRSGEIRVSEISAERIEIDGRPCLIAVVRDVTDRERAEEEVLRLNAELEQRVQRRTAELEVANQELESFSYSVSHDLRAPLRSIHGFAQALLEDHAAQIDDTGRRHLARIQAAARRMGQLIDDLLQLSRVTRSEIKRKPVDLTALAREVMQDMHSGDPERRVEVVIHDGLQGTGDARLLRVVLENLLGNAWKFTSRRDAARIEFGLKPGSAGIFRVQDNGAGFDMAYADKLFGAFQRLHGAKDFPGTGVGLATVRRIIRRHGGIIWAQAEVDHGCVFYFTLGEGDERNE
jgi:PAS domain S-box-containing protein